MGGSSVTKMTAQCHAEPGDLCWVYLRNGVSGVIG
jgi:hypothetical protein